MVLVMARQEARPQESRPKTLKRELENNSSKPRDQVKNRQSYSLKKGQLTLSQGKMDKGDDVADDDDDDAALRTNVSQDQLAVAMCTKEFFLMTRYIWVSPHIREVKMLGGGRIWTVNTTHLVVPAGFHTSQLVLHVIYRVS
jgi:hypothetical protein